MYSYLTTLEEDLGARVNPLRPTFVSWKALKDVLQRAYISRSNLDWTKYLPAPPNTALTNRTALVLNPYIPEQSDCTFGCLGHLCDAADACAPDLLCKNSVCQQTPDSQPGKIGDRCDSKNVCQEHILCSKGSCQDCSPRQSIRPESRRKRTIASEPPPEDPHTRVVANDINASCHSDSLPSLFALSARQAASSALPICLSPSTPPRGNPCASSTHCSADQYCDWGLCKQCTSSDHCLGAKCKSNNKCKTGFCNTYGRCDYPGQKKIFTGPGGTQQRSRDRARMQGVERGPAKVRDNVVRVNIPGEKVEQTGQAGAEATTV
jgi:hypothetical protein